MVIFGYKQLHLKLNWKFEGHLYATSFANIFTVFTKFFYLQFLTHEKHMQSPIQIGAQNRRIIRQKN